MFSFSKIYNWLPFDIMWHYKNLEILLMCIIFLAVEQHCPSPRDSPAILSDLIYFESSSARDYSKGVRFLLQLYEIKWVRLTNKIKCNHGYYYFWLTFILHVTLSRPCWLVPVLLVYTNLSPPILVELSTSLWQTSTDHHHVQNWPDTPFLCVIVLHLHMRECLLEMQISRPPLWLPNLPRDSDAHKGLRTTEWENGK